MAEIIVFHHARGLTDGVLAFAERLRELGHTVYAPDLFDGRLFGTTEDGVAHAQELGFDTIADRGVAFAEQLPPELVYVGFSMGVVPAQRLAQTRQGALGAVLCHSALPPSEFGPWPAAVPVQIHAKEEDPWFVEDRESAEHIAATAPHGELFLYPGAEHLFADSSTTDYDPDAAALMEERITAFLAPWA